MIRLALIGLGNMGGKHLKNIQQLESYGKCKLTCICDIDKEKIDKINEKLNVNSYYDVESMIEDNCFDAAIIAITSINHFDVAKLLIENTKPVLIEKPVTVTLEEADELYSLAKKNNVLISAGYTEVYNSVTDGFKECMQKDNNFNYIDFYRIGLYSKKNDKKDIDVIQDLLTHDLAVLSEVVDLDEVKDINGNAFNYNEVSGKYDSVNVTLLFKNGNIARFIMDRCSSIKERKFNISKKDMFGTFDYMDQTAYIREKGTIKAFGNNIWYSENYDTAQIRYSNNPLFEEIKDFLSAIESGTQTKVSKNWYKITKVVEMIRNKLC